MDKQITLMLINDLLGDESIASREDLPDTIHFLLKPFLSKKRSNKLHKDIASKLEKILRSKNICIRCYSQKVKYPTDFFCRMCKHCIKEEVKKKLNEDCNG